MNARPSLCARLWSARPFYVRLLLALSLVQAVLYVVDPGVQFNFGDSAAYLEAAHGHVPRDRSWTYGVLIKHLTMSAQDLDAVVASQVCAHVAASALLAVMLREYFGARPSVTAGTAMVASLLPHHLVWTRYIMTETFGLAALALWMLLAFEYLRSGRWLWLLPLQLVGVCAVSLRVPMLPVVLGGAVALPLLALWARRQRGGAEPRPRSLARLALHVVVSVGCMLPLHHAYKAEYAQRLAATGDVPAPVAPKYSYENGLFYLEFVAPAVEPQDFPAGLDGAELLARAVGDEDPRLRNYQHWRPDGLVAVLRDALAANPQVAPSLDALCTTIAWRAFTRDPLGALGLAWHTFTDFWDSGYCAGILRYELGLTQLAPDRARERLRHTYGIDIGERTRVQTPLKRAYLAMQPYIVALTLAFAVPLLLWRARPRTRPYLLLLVGGVVYFWATTIFLSSLPSGRFQLPLSWLLWLAVAGRLGSSERGGILGDG